MFAICVHTWNPKAPGMTEQEFLSRREEFMKDLMGKKVPVRSMQAVTNWKQGKGWCVWETDTIERLEGIMAELESLSKSNWTPAGPKDSLIHWIGPVFSDKAKSPMRVGRKATVFKFFFRDSSISRPTSRKKVTLQNFIKGNEGVRVMSSYALMFLRKGVLKLPMRRLRGILVVLWSLFDPSFHENLPH
jgi:hypothetical protein